jgi:membrane peptidoglycan carboxypeptidase
VLASVEEQGVSRGASTITQQLARGIFTGGERTAARKLRELLFAVEMERTLGKRMILALYLNTVDWGPGICGADAAARIYFGKRPGELTPLEAAWLASILPNPAQAYENEFLVGAADPARAARVLRQMRGLPRVERERWAAQTLAFAPGGLRASQLKVMESACRNADRTPCRESPAAAVPAG